MKPYTVVNRISPVVGVALLLAVFTLSFGNSKIDRDYTCEVKGTMQGIAFAQGEPPSPANNAALSDQDKIKEEFFPGSHIKVEEAVKKASLIIVGRFVDPGIRGFDSPNKISHGMAKVEVLQILKGYVSEELSLTFEVYNEPSDKAEKAPEVGQQYIVFINEKAVVTALKFLPDSEERRWQITELVSSALNGKR